MEIFINTGLDHGEYYTGRSKRSPLGPNRTAPTIGRMFGHAPCQCTQERLIRMLSTGRSNAVRHCLATSRLSE